MKRKDRVEMELQRQVKIRRTKINLEFRLLADEALNEALPALEDEFYSAVSAGRPFEIDATSVINR